MSEREETMELALELLRTERDGLQSRLHSCEDALEVFKRELSEKSSKLDSCLGFLERAGYRQCDIPACNCGEWHKNSPQPISSQENNRRQI